MSKPCWTKLMEWALVLLMLTTLLLVPGNDARFGGSRGGGRGGGSRGRGSSSGSHGWSSSHSSSKGNWFTNLFVSSKASSAASSPSVSNTNTNVAHNYPRQPAYNPSFDKPPPYSRFDSPPSYSSLYPQGSHGHPHTFSGTSSIHANTFTGGSRPFQPQTVQQNVFPMFTPQTQSYNSYHFIPFVYPMHSHSTYHHYYGGSGTSHYGSQAAASTTPEPAVVTPASITTPIIYDLNVGSPDIKFEKPSLVVVVNNMVVYGEMMDEQQIVMIINEDFEQPDYIPEHFLLADVESEEDLFYLPWNKSSTTTTRPERSTMESIVEGLESTTTITAVPISVAEVNTVGKIDATQVLNNQWFSDIDGGN